MTSRRLTIFLAVLFASSLVLAAPETAPLALSANASGLVYTALPQPCRVIDTRLAGGPLASTRNFHITGSASLADQGGEAAGCGIPAGAGKTAAVMINFVAAAPSGLGNLRASAWPNPVPAAGSIINYQARTIANAVVFPVCDYTAADCANGFDITVYANGVSTDLVADVFGYFSKFDPASSAPQPTYTSLPEPCRLIDTRPSSRPLGAGVPQDFVVTGTTGFEAQGGTAGGCGIPSGATAAMITLFAGSPDGVGNVKGAAYPNAIPSHGSLINYDQDLLDPFLPYVFSNSVVFPLCDRSVSACSADLTLEANASATSVVVDVLGYFADGQQQVPGIPATQQNLLYTTLPQPCRIIDTRLLTSPDTRLYPWAPRHFKVTGTTDFELQGGTPGGCGVPPGATVAMVNFVAVASAAGNELKATAYGRPMPDDQCNGCTDPTRGSILEQHADDAVAGAVLLPVCDPAVSNCTYDITLESSGMYVAGSLAVVADVIGYAQPATPGP